MRHHAKPSYAFLLGHTGVLGDAFCFDLRNGWAAKLEGVDEVLGCGFGFRPRFFMRGGVAAGWLRHDRFGGGGGSG